MARWFWISFLLFLAACIAIIGTVEYSKAKLAHDLEMKRLEKLPNTEVWDMNGQRFLVWRMEDHQ